MNENETKNENTLPVQQGEEGKKSFSKIALILAGAYLITMIVSNVLNQFLIPIANDFSSEADATTLKTIVSFIPMYVVCFPLIILLAGRMKKTPPAGEKLGGKRVFVLFSMVFPIMFAGSLIGNFLSALFSAGKSENQLVDLLSSLNPLTIAVAAFIGPVFEEIVFRKLIIDRTVCYGEKASILFSALCFGMFHMNLYQFFYAFGIGLILGYIYVRSGDIKITIIIHMIINSLSSIIVPILVEKSDILNFSKMTATKEVTESFIMENMEYFQEHMIWIMLYMLYILVYFGMVCFGIAMLIVKRKKLDIHRSEWELDEKSEIRNSLVNLGMIVYTVFTVALIALSLFRAAMQ